MRPPCLQQVIMDIVSMYCQAMDSPKKGSLHSIYTSTFPCSLIFYTGSIWNDKVAAVSHNPGTGCWIGCKHNGVTWPNFKYHNIFYTNILPNTPQDYPKLPIQPVATYPRIFGGILVERLWGTRIWGPLKQPILLPLPPHPALGRNPKTWVRSQQGWGPAGGFGKTTPDWVALASIPTLSPNTARTLKMKSNSTNAVLKPWNPFHKNDVWCFEKSYKISIRVVPPTSRRFPPISRRFPPRFFHPNLISVQEFCAIELYPLLETRL